MVSLLWSSEITFFFLHCLSETYGKLSISKTTKKKKKKCGSKISWNNWKINGRKHTGRRGIESSLNIVIERNLKQELAPLNGIYSVELGRGGSGSGEEKGRALLELIDNSNAFPGGTFFYGKFFYGWCKKYGTFKAVAFRSFLLEQV